jgi:hypothetical protein
MRDGIPNCVPDFHLEQEEKEFRRIALREEAREAVKGMRRISGIDASMKCSEANCPHCKSCPGVWDFDDEYYCELEECLLIEISITFWPQHCIGCEHAVVTVDNEGSGYEDTYYCKVKDCIKAAERED